MTPADVAEAMRLASLYATARARRATAQVRGTVHSTTSLATMDESVTRAENRLRAHLRQFMKGNTTTQTDDNT